MLSSSDAIPSGPNMVKGSKKNKLSMQYIRRERLLPNPQAPWQTSLKIEHTDVQETTHDAFETTANQNKSIRIFVPRT